MANDSAPIQGIAGHYTGDSLALQATLATLLGCALYSAIELILLIFLTFRQYSGLYFWSLLVTTGLGIIPQALGLLLKYFNLAPIFLSVTLTTFGWAIMVTGQSVVLYSRLHLVVRNPLVLRGVLAMIVVDAFILQTPHFVFSYGVVSNDGDRYLGLYSIWEKLQITGFFVQEVIISTIFLVQTVRLLALYPNRSKRRTHIMYQLLIINAAIILMDISLLVLEYLNIYIIQVSLKTFFYTIKLKFEFAVLSRLVSFVNYDPEQDSSVTFMS
ncbi:uncharacterized protein BP01DRAFT_226900 [Aspergillus saccharolyticus JOP 1030-1]|uniref:DUF7703 domain-containing protein n=1 Tax=Aspergillus saccharolyticus JOP 1030-1 TaxID=1450539 RepID=A0A318ZJV6_9EURO|nr:hypothetical protein BP01DRAFT_226900 [Aspergillus saccharolyticus JOP 1030-1]PYH47085.1 hypothetical protein BP01DRAFT_226900 [Aspergillus saccharolyticus JOP 1030-1]